MITKFFYGSVTEISSNFVQRSFDAPLFYIGKRKTALCMIRTTSKGNSMKITMVVTRTTYGTIDIDVPDDSVINSEASAGIKRKAAKRLAEKAINENRVTIDWDEPEPVEINSGYFVPVEE